MKNKYNIDFTREEINKNVTRLINQTWKLIPMKEHEEDWEKQLETVIIEIAGMNEVFLHLPQLLQVLSKMEGLKVTKDIEFLTYRKTVFEVISLLQELKNV